MKKFIPRNELLKTSVERSETIYMQLLNYSTFECFGDKWVSMYKDQDNNTVTACFSGGFNLYTGVSLNEADLNLVCIGYFYYE